MKLEPSDTEKEWDDIFKAIGKKNLKLSESEVLKKSAQARKHQDDQMPRLVLNTNTPVNAIISHGKQRELFRRGNENQFLIATSDPC